jgi:hypothetical protein
MLINSRITVSCSCGNSFAYDSTGFAYTGPNIYCGKCNSLMLSQPATPFPYFPGPNWTVAAGAACAGTAVMPLQEARTYTIEIGAGGFTQVTDTNKKE